MSNKKQELLDAEEASWRELHARLDKLSDDDWVKPGVNGDWSAKDVMVHVAAWHAVTTDRFEVLRTMGTLPEYPPIDEFNRDQYEKNKDLSVHDVRVMSSAARHRFREELAQLPADLGENLVRICEGNAHGHYDEHIEQLDTFLGSA
ncbi:MAG: DinB family protein [Actinomycetota bacterium]